MFRWFVGNGARPADSSHLDHVQAYSIRYSSCPCAGRNGGWWRRQRGRHRGTGEQSISKGVQSWQLRTAHPVLHETSSRCSVRATDTPCISPSTPGTTTTLAITLGTSLSD